MDQKNVFMSREGNEWYERNKAAILDKSLAQLAEHYGACCYGVDPSASAIQGIDHGKCSLYLN